MHILRGRRHSFMRKPYFTLCLFSWCFMVHCVYVLNMHISLCLFGRSFVLLCGHCSHFYMTVLVFDQVAHIFHIMFTWSQFTCYIILVLLLLALPWGPNVFCASVSSYKYICSKFITAFMIHDRRSDMIGDERKKELCVILTMFLLCS